ncbi:MAG: sigma-70 family RNA polymerase sigma factor [Clostridia bacterium]|nr:sigma-70 family RNA polymerase sigma factor [Clostridia bacterium]
MDTYLSLDIGELILLCRSHNDEAFDELLRRYTPMMRKVILSFDQSSYEYSELFSEACVALHIAAQRYDLSQNEVTFGLYARICVRNRILDLLRSAEIDHTAASLDIELMADDDSVEQRLADREIFDMLLNSARNLLSDYEYRVLMLHIQGYKTAAIADMLSRSAKSVDNAKSRLFRRLRSEIGDISKI